MARSVRLSEKWFNRGLWLVALIFAGFLTGLGSLVVNDLPQVEHKLTIDDYLDKVHADPVRSQIKTLETETASLEASREKLALEAGKAGNEYRQERETFNNWLAARNATQRSAQDPEVLARTRKLDSLKAAEVSVQRKISEIDAQLLSARQALSPLRQANDRMEKAASVKLERVESKQELRVFAYRLMVTLPLLLVAVWLFVKRRKSQHWPFVWGFIFFALYTFFVELVPYLPSYGGYVRSVVGLILTFVAGNYAIKAMRQYLERQKIEEAQPDNHRRQSLSYDLVLVRLSKKVCPGCERPVDLVSLDVNHCPHCGIGIFNNCEDCSARKNAFSPFCHRCGKPSGVTMVSAS